MYQSKNGFFGPFGGAYIPEILQPAIEELQGVVERLRADNDFWQRYCDELKRFSGRPTPITPLENLSRQFESVRFFAKREDLNHTGAHKINNVIGQGLIAKELGKTRVIAETGAGQHGVATAIMAARFGLECVIYMGAEDVERQYANVFWMRQMGAEVIAVKEGAQTLKDAINAAMRDWVSSFETSHYVLGTACGPHPFPELVGWLQSIIGQEARQQMCDDYGCLPDRVYACVGGGSNAMGLFSGFYRDESVALIGVEAGGRGLSGHEHAARICGKQGKPGVAHGYKSLFLQDDDGQMRDTHSISAGLDYVGVSPILAHHHAQGRVQFEAATDDEVLATLKIVMTMEGLIPALESTHAFAAALRAAKMITDPKKPLVFLINQSGRGDKDIFTIGDAINPEEWQRYLRSRC